MWGRPLWWAVTIDAVLLAILPLALLADLNRQPVSEAILLAWAACGVVFTLATLLAGPVSHGLWSGYLNLIAMTCGLLFGFGYALVVILGGTTVAAGLRLAGFRLDATAPVSPAAAADDLVRRFAISGLPVAFAFALYIGIGGQVPLASDARGWAQGLLVVVLAAALTQVFGWWLTADHQAAVPLLWQRDQRHRLLGELLLVIVVPPLTAIYSDAGPWVFTVMLMLVSAQAMRYVQHNHYQQALTRRIDQLTALNQISRAISSSLALDDVARSIAQWAAGAFPRSVFYISLRDEVSDRMTYPVLLRWAKAAPDDAPKLTVLCQHVQDNNDPVVLQEGHPLMQQAGLEGVYLGFPLTVGTKQIGVMGLIEPDRDAGADRQFEREALIALANQIALALRNATLYQRAARLTDHLTRINQVVPDVMFNLDNISAIRTACETAYEVVEADAALVMLMDDENPSQWRVVHSLALHEGQGAAYEEPDLVPGLIHNETLVITDAALLPQAHPLARLLHGDGFQAGILVPLRSGTMRIGLMAALHRQVHVYRATDIDMLEMLAHQVTAALENTDLLNALETYASEQAQLVHLSRITTSSMDLERVVDDVADLFRRMLGVTYVTVGLVPPDTNYMQIYSPEADLRRALVLEDMPEIERLLHQTQAAPVLLQRHEVPISAGLSVWMDDAGVVVVVVMPMIVRDQQLGVVLIGDAMPRAFDDRALRLIEMASNQIASQVYNAQQYQITRDALNRRMRQLAAIESIAQQISSSLDLETLIHNVLETALRATEADFAALALGADEPTLRLICLEHAGAQTWHRSEIPWRRELGLIGYTLEHKSLLNITTADDYPDYRPVRQGVFVESALLMPLVHSGQVVGVLTLESGVPSFFDQEAVDFVQSLAGHAVISIQNANMLQERQGRIQALERLHDLALTISADTGYPETALAVLGVVREILAAQAALLYAVDPATGTLARVAATSDDLFAADALPDWLLHPAIQNETTLSVADVAQQLPRAACESLLAVPIKYDGAVRELIVVTFEDEAATAASQDNRVPLLALQAASHLQSARLYARLQTQNDRMQAILDTTRDGVMLLDRDGHLIEANASAERLLHITLRRETAARPDADSRFDLLTGAEGEVETLRQALETVRQAVQRAPESVTSAEFEVQTEDNLRFIQQASSPVMDSQQQIVGRLVTLRDITEEKLLAAYRDEVSNMVVHDLRGPLGSIISSLALALEVAAEYEDEAMQTMMNIALESATNLLDLVDSLLDIAKLETRRMPLERSAQHLAPIIEDASRAMTVTLAEADITLSVDLPHDLPPVDVDADKLRRVFINLLDNAIRFTPSGQQVIVQVEQRGDKVYVSVADSGPGIAPSDAHLVFEKFRQIEDTAPQRGRKGSGLGLTFCKLAIEAHDEQIWVARNSPLSGACFTFTLAVGDASGAVAQPGRSADAAR